MKKNKLLNEIDNIYYYFYNQMLEDQITYEYWQQIKETIQNIKMIIYTYNHEK